jgi:uncharacterized protein
MTETRSKKWFDICGWLLLGAVMVSPLLIESKDYYSKQPQLLPVEAQLTVNESVIELEVATTPQEQAIGLMHRTSLPADRGMMFPVTPPGNVETWMRNVRFDIDILFIRSERIVSIALAAPCYGEKCPIYRSKTEVDQVVELSGGSVESLSLKVGDRISIRRF